MRTVLLTSTKTRNLSPKQYLLEAKKNKALNNIECVKFIPPRANSQGYGFFQVTYKMPVLVVR